MPELPEVEIIQRGLALHLAGQQLHNFWHSGKPLRHSVPTQALRRLEGNRIINISRRAKYILFSMHCGGLLIFHLGMTGNLGIFPANTPLRKHDHLQWELEHGQVFRFHDPRRFGSVAFLDKKNLEKQQRDFFRNCGAEPLAPSFTGEYLQKKAQRRSLAVKPFIMTNQIVVGIGNIYANEALFQAGIRPDRSVQDISLKEWNQVVCSIQKTLKRAIECGGSTISDFKNASQQSGYFQINFKVYGRTGKPCAACGTQLEKKNQGGRASFFCPNCQK